ncbi:MAG: D-Ala-D-Ala carboxypeptidase family metallohydrolase, partial [Rikenellaceae bacterium]
MKISDHFALEEFTQSTTAKRLGIQNEPEQYQKENIKNLVIKLLEPLRKLYGLPLKINSGYRCSELNRAVGGVDTSQHLLGEAADVACENPQHLLNKLKDSNLDFDQAILYPTFLHLSLKSVGENRKSLILKVLLFVLFCFSGCSKPIYLQGKSEYIEKVVTKDTTIYLEIERQVVKSIAEDSSFLETSFALSNARIDTLGRLYHSLEQKQSTIERVVEYKDRVITIRDSIPYPQIIKEVKQVKHVPTAFWISMIVSVFFIAKTVYKLFS